MGYGAWLMPIHLDNRENWEGFPVGPIKEAKMTTMATEPTGEPMLQFFEYGHLKTPELKAASAPFAELAKWIVNELPRNPERTAALRKLLEAKDCAVRARLYK
jgi:hypothetical protein